MAKRRKSAAESFHDRYANIYDSRYTGNPYWEIYDGVTWEHLRRFLPKDLSTRVLDIGCGTGKWGLRLAKSGYQVTLSDISQGMLDQAARKAEEMGLGDRVAFHKGDMATLEGLPNRHFGLVVAQGDPLSCVERPAQAIKAVARVTEPAGIFVASVDSRWAGIGHHLAAGDLRSLEQFLRTGKSVWLTDKKASQFPLHMFWPAELQKALEKQGFSVLDMLGKTALVGRDTPEEVLSDPSARRRLVQLELRYGREPDALGRAAHIQVVARKGTETQ